MRALRRVAVAVLFCAFFLLRMPGAFSSEELADGQHDFDFNIGTWHTEISRLAHPLAGSATWTGLRGTVVVRKVWNGRANLEEVEADGASGHFEDLGLFLYDPQAHLWSQHFANSKTGTLSVPAIGAFKNGRGEFYNQEMFNGKSIFVRQVWSHITSDSHRFEQAFSPDGGRTWETNFRATLNRIPVRPPQAVATHSGAHDFDFDFGTWKMDSSRMRHPLSGFHSWYDMHGTTVNWKIWSGRSNLAEVETDGPTGHLELLALRLYNPVSRQWSISFATSNVGKLGVPVIGDFKHGRGQLYDHEEYNGKSILVRFVIYPVTSISARSEQAFSEDGGKTWETNWINRYTRTSTHA